MEDIVSIHDYIIILKRRKWSLLLPTLIVFVIAAIIALVIPPTYRSTSTVLIEEQGVPRDFVVNTMTGFAEQRLQLISQRVMSTASLLEIINRFNLYADYRKKKATEEIIEMMRKDIKFQTISADVVDSRTGRPSSVALAFSLSYEGQNPGLVQQVATVLTSLYLEQNLQIREQQSVGTAKFLDEEKNDLKSQVGRLDAEISAFKGKNMNALPELLQVNMQGLDRAEMDIRQMNDQIRTLKERESYLQIQLASIPTDANDQDRTLQKELKARLLQLESRLSDRHPDVIKAKSEIAELERRLSAKPANTDRQGGQPDNPTYVTLSAQLAGAQSEIESAKRQITELSKKRDEYRVRIETSPKVDEKYRTLLVERNNMQAKYDDIVRKSMEAKVSQGLEKEQMGERFTLVDPARLPEKPVKPNIPAILLIGLILGAGAGVGTAALKEHLYTAVRTAEELIQAISLPVLASIPEIVPPGIIKKRGRKRMITLLAIVAAIIAGILIFHLYIMDLNVLWAKIARRFNI